MKIIDKLPNKHSSWYNNISNNLIKRIQKCINLTLTANYQSNFEDRNFPRKITNVESYSDMKKDDKSQLNNYRQIYLSVISEIIEQKRRKI